MKILLATLFILNSFSLADELLTYTKGKKSYAYCIEDYYVANNRIYFKKSNSNYYTYERYSKIKTLQIQSGFIYKNRKCIKPSLTTSDYKATSNLQMNHNNLSFLGLSNEQLNFMFALSGAICSFMFLFGLFRWI